MEQTESILQKIREMLGPLGFEIHPFKVMSDHNFLDINVCGKCQIEITIDIFIEIPFILINILTSEKMVHDFCFCIYNLCSWNILKRSSHFLNKHNSK